LSKNPCGNLTKVAPANTMGTSVKTTIPSYLVGKYGIHTGDMLEWSDDGRCMIIRKVEGKKRKT